MPIEHVLHDIGGVASRATLIELTSRAEFDRAVREGRLDRIAHGRYALPHAHLARRAAASLHGVVSHLSAAQYYGWEVKHPPVRPAVTLKHNRHPTPEQCAQVEAHWSDLATDDIHEGWVTSRPRTFIDCCRHLPFDEALAVADSARRHGELAHPRMLQLAESMRGPGRLNALRVAQEATSLAANPFESVLRAIALDVPGLSVRPQVLVLQKPFRVRPDLIDERLRLAIEAESFAWHGDSDALHRDCQRYTLLAIHGWRLIRFTWKDVMRQPDYVRYALTEAVRRASREAQQRSIRRPAA
jgi:very-short-patch-repair endonuclease